MEPSPPDAGTSLISDPALRIALDVGHVPLPGWRVSARPADAEGRANWDVVYQGQPAPIFLGYFRTYKGYGEPNTRGLARSSSVPNSIGFEPRDWTEFGSWPELLFPTAWAESNANFCVINAWDRAAMTFGFIQLAAHTGDDFLPMFRALLRGLPGEARQWFPELGLVGGKLCFVRSGRYRSLENEVRPWDGGYTADYYHGDLMGFFNPDRYHATTPIDPAELHAGARWLLWTMTSRAMRAIQVLESIANLKQSVAKVHAAILASATLRARYPGGVDRMPCDLLSVLIAAPHLGDQHMATVRAALAQPDPVKAMKDSNYGPPGRSKNVDDGMAARLALKSLVYDLALGAPV